ncbi:hypothetical protein CGLO_18163 [Colletotrichum gloeosporioides Cg-14]|uniref:Uncharacterized protein n=1 Tax=Colletotrichum gloeosporioides (strain Cg-14) TaxID=1237896 RepID=T0JIK2_COLGC|nr:hypothetical protein CGLO_18163 [Colletotrichum gloeosporioides Cg-14]
MQPEYWVDIATAIYENYDHAVLYAAKS